MGADADPDPQSWREEEEQKKQPGDLGSVDDPSNDDDLLIAMFHTGGGGFSVDIVAERLVSQSVVVVCR